MDPSLTALRGALRSLDWETRLRAIEVIVELREVRLRDRLRMLARFHLAPRPVREAARRAVIELDAMVAEASGRVSLQVVPPPEGRVSLDRAAGARHPRASHKRSGLLDLCALRGRCRSD